MMMPGVVAKRFFLISYSFPNVLADTPCVRWLHPERGKRRNASTASPRLHTQKGGERLCSFRVRTDNENLTPWVLFVLNQLRVYSIGTPPLEMSPMSISHGLFPVTPPGSPGQPILASVAGRIRGHAFPHEKTSRQAGGSKTRNAFLACRERAGRRSVNIWGG